MIYVALASLGVLAVAIVSGAGLFRSLERQHAREREQLLARIMHLAGKTWEIPPARETPVEDEMRVAARDYSWGDDAPVAS